MLVRERHRRALHTVFLFLGGSLGAAYACERLDDRIAEGDSASLRAAEWSM